jgi:hypothetical protein
MKPLLLFLLPTAGLVSGWFLRPLIQPPDIPALTSDSSTTSSGPVSSATAPATAKTYPAAPALVKSQPLPPLNPAAPQATIKALLAFSRSGKNPLRTQARILAFTDQLNPAQLKALAMEAANQPSSFWGTGNDIVKNLLLSTWAEAAPQEALAFVTGSNSVEARQAQEAVFCQLALTDPKAAEAALGRLGEGRKKEATRALAIKIGETRPMEALALLDRQKVESGNWAYASIYSTWARNHPAEATSHAMSLPDGMKRNQALTYLARGYAESDPQGALAWAKSLPRASESLNLVRTVISGLAERDPQAALVMAQQESPREQRGLLSSIAQNWMSSDPDSAVAWIKTLPNDATRQQCISYASFYAAWGGPGENLTQLMALLPKGKTRTESLDNVSRYLGWSDPEASLAWAKTLPQEDQDVVIARLSSSLADSDPKKAAALAAALPLTANSVNALTEVASQWANKNPEEAIAWAATLETEKARQDATAAALTQWADIDPQKAANASASLADENARRAAREKIAATWAQKSPAEAERWAASLPEADRYSALASVWNAAASDDPAKAAASLAANLPAASAIDSANTSLAASASTIATSWVNQNPQAAAAWATQLPAGKAQESAMAAIASEWANTDTLAASTWINQLPTGSARDEAAGKLIEKITPTDPAAAFTWAANIQDPDKQLASLKSTINAWKIYNPAAVRETLANSNLDAATQAKLQAELR